jgi:K+-transporting ATPase ATPase A chain
VFYEYTSAFANNGSGFEGLGDATVWWNLSCAWCWLLGRYPGADDSAGHRRDAGAQAPPRRAPARCTSKRPTFALT